MSCFLDYVVRKTVHPVQWSGGQGDGCWWASYISYIAGLDAGLVLKQKFV